MKFTCSLVTWCTAQCAHRLFNATAWVVGPMGDTTCWCGRHSTATDCSARQLNSSASFSLFSRNASQFPGSRVSG